MEASLRKALTELELIDQNGKLLLEDTPDFEYYASCGDRVLTNTNKPLEELKSAYSAECVSGRDVNYPKGMHRWYDHEFSWYTTNYGLTYFFVGFN